GDRPGEVLAEDEGEAVLHRLPYITRGDRHVEPVDRRRGHPHQHLPGGGARGVDLGDGGGRGDGIQCYGTHEQTFRSKWNDLPALLCHKWAGRSTSVEWRHGPTTRTRTACRRRTQPRTHPGRRPAPVRQRRAGRLHG